MKKINLFFLLIFVAFGCIERKCYNTYDIHVPELLLISADRRDIDYCSLLQGALSHDAKKIKEFSLLRFDAGNSYEHGTVLVDVIKLIGEMNYVLAIENISEEQREYIKTRIKMGLQTPRHRNRYDSYTIEEVFPQLHIFIEGKN